MEGKSLLPEEQKEERDYQRRPHICGLFFSKNRKKDMKYSESLKKNRDFQFVYKNGISYSNRYLVMYIFERETDKNRLGISVSKKVGNSIVRHRLTRLIRESYRLQEERFKCGYDIVVIARTSAREKNYVQIESALLHLGRLHKIINEG